jgi:hypothetical protein
MIHFYFMNGCPHCVAAQRALSSEIASGQVIFKRTSEVPKGLNIKGFPYFVNTSNGLSHPGWPGSKQKLFLMLNFTGTGSGTVSDIGIGHGTGSGSGTGMGTGTGRGSGTGSGTGSGSGTGMGTGTGRGSGTGSGTGSGSGSGTGNNKPPFIFVGDGCPNSRGGYLTLSQTWGKQLDYTA